MIGREDDALALERRQRRAERAQRSRRTPTARVRGRSEARHPEPARDEPAGPAAERGEKGTTVDRHGLASRTRVDASNGSSGPQRSPHAHAARHRNHRPDAGDPEPEPKGSYDFMRPLFRDEESRKSFEFPVEYMFKDVPKTGRHEDYIRYTLDEMDTFGIERALIGVAPTTRPAQRALKQHPDRFLPSCGVDPNEGMEAVREIVRAVRGSSGSRPSARSRRAASRRCRSTTSASTRSTRSACELDLPIFVLRRRARAAHPDGARRRSSSSTRSAGSSRSSSS